MLIIYAADNEYKGVKGCYRHTLDELNFLLERIELQHKKQIGSQELERNIGEETEDMAKSEKEQEDEDEDEEIQKKED